MKKTDYTSSCQQRILKVLLAMFGHEIDGLAPGQIAKLAEITPQEATRDIHNLVVAGYVEQVPHNGQYRVSPCWAARHWPSCTPSSAPRSAWKKPATVTPATHN